MAVTYRFLAEENTPTFCDKVTKALSEGQEQHGNTSHNFDIKLGHLRCGQPVTKVTDATYYLKKRDLQSKKMIKSNTERFCDEDVRRMVIQHTVPRGIGAGERTI